MADRYSNQDRTNPTEQGIQVVEISLKDLSNHPEYRRLIKKSLCFLGSEEEKDEKFRKQLINKEPVTFEIEDKGGVTEISKLDFVEFCDKSSNIFNPRCRKVKGNYNKFQGRKITPHPYNKLSKKFRRR